MGFTIFLILAVFVGAVIFAVINQTAKAEAAQTLEGQVKAEFSADEVHVSQDDGSLIGFAFDQDSVVLGNKHSQKTYLFSQIAAVEIVKDGASVTATNRGSQALGAAVGGLALGGVGLLAGALSGTKTSQQRVRELAVKVTVDDRTTPVHVVTLFRAFDKKGAETSSAIVKAAVDRADRINGHLVNAMRRAQGAPVVGKPDYAQQVERLWSLHQAGALSAEEFQQQKLALSPPG